MLSGGKGKTQVTSPAECGCIKKNKTQKNPNQLKKPHKQEKPPKQTTLTKPYELFPAQFGFKSGFRAKFILLHITKTQLCKQVQVFHVHFCRAEKSVSFSIAL